jgi:hypothetical protein
MTVAPRALSRRVIAAAAVVAGLSVVAGGAVVLDQRSAAEAAGSGSTSLRAGFESGTFDAWSAVNSTRLSSSCSNSGAYGACAVTTPTDGGYLEWTPADVAQGMRYARVRGWVRLDSGVADQSIGVMTVKNDYGSRHFDIFRDPDSGKWRWDLFRGDHATSTMQAEIGEWYYMEALVDFGGTGGTTYTAQVRINGVDQPSIESDGMTGSTVKAAWFGGKADGRTNSRSYDGLALDVGDSPFSFTR